MASSVIPWNLTLAIDSPIQPSTALKIDKESPPLLYHRVHNPTAENDLIIPPQS